MLRSRLTESSRRCCSNYYTFFSWVTFYWCFFFFIYFCSSCPTSTDLCVEKTEFLRCNSPTHWPHGEEQQDGSAKPAVSLLSLVSFPLLVSSGQSLRGNSPLMGQLMSSAVSPCTQHSGPKFVTRCFLHIFFLFLHFCVPGLTYLCFYFSLYRVYLWRFFLVTSRDAVFNLWILSLLFPCLRSVIWLERLYRSGKNWGVYVWLWC